MRGFFIILCLAFTQAERFGYNNGQSGTHNVIESRSRHRGNTISTPTSSTNTRGIRSEINNGRSRYSTDSVQSRNVAAPVEANYDKEFYSYSAPEDDFKDTEAVQRLVSAMRKNIRVVFIKAPENNVLTNAILQLAQQNAEAKTAIYVLTKQTDIGELTNQVQNIQYSKESKPEVHFVKYRTPEDAVHAQQIIQNDYDALGGLSRVSKEDVAPVLDFSLKNDEAVTNANINNNIRPMNSFATSLNAYFPSKTRN